MTYRPKRMPTTRPKPTRKAPAASAARSTRARTERLETRIAAADKALIEQAAELRGMTVSEFVIAVLRRASQKTVEQLRTLEYSRRDQAALVSALFDTGRATSRLRRATRRYRQAFNTK